MKFEIRQLCITAVQLNRVGHKQRAKLMWSQAKQMFADNTLPKTTIDLSEIK